MTSVVAVVVAYGDTPLLARCVTALTGSHDVEVEVVVVDNGAAPEAIADVAALPSVRVVASPANVGFGAGCNLGVAASASTFVAFVNPDVVVERGAMAALAAALADDSVGIATASVRLLDEPGLLNSAGGAVHFLGIGWADAFRAPATSRPSDRDVMAASGAAMAMRRGVFDELGGFTPEFFLYHEDAELSVRCRLRGWRVRYVAGAVVHHHYEFSRNPGKLYYLERNRLCIVLACYSWRTLLLLLPALLALEVGMVALAFAQGWGREKLRGWAWLVGHARWLGAHRRRVQSGRRVGDRDLAPLFAPRFTAGQVDLPRWLRPADAALALYWRAVSRLV